MNEFQRAIEVLKAKLNSYDGKLYKSMGAESLACGSEIYDKVLVQSIDVDVIRNSGAVVLAAHYPSKYTGRWETTTVWCNTAEEALSVIDKCLGKPAAELP